MSACLQNIQDYNEVAELIKSGGIMIQPENCDDFFYKLMKSCWKFEPSSRLKFQGIIKNLLATYTNVDREFLMKFEQNSFFFSEANKAQNNAFNFILNWKFSS